MNFFGKNKPRPFICTRFHQNPSTSAISVLFWNFHYVRTSSSSRDLRDSHFTGRSFLHRLENRPQNPRNQPTLNGCRNRASWWILMKPCANERAGFNFSKKIWILNFSQFFKVLHLFEHRPDSYIRIYLKNAKMSCFCAKRWVFRVKFCWTFFSEVFLLSNLNKTFSPDLKLHF